MIKKLRLKINKKNLNTNIMMKLYRIIMINSNMKISQILIIMNMMKIKLYMIQIIKPLIIKNTTMN